VRDRLLASLGSQPGARQRARGAGWGRLVLVPVLAASAAAALFIGIETLRAPDEATAATVLTVLSGEVRVQSLSLGGVPGSDGMLLQAGDRLITGRGARAVLAFFDGSTLTLESDTEVGIRALREENGRLRVLIEQPRGSTWAHLPRLLGPARFEIETPNARVQAQDGLFVTTVEAGGRTQVSSQAGAVTLKSGQRTTAVRTGSPIAVETPGVVVAAAPKTPSRELTIRVRGTAFALLLDPSDAAVGIAYPGVPVNQIPGATAKQESGELVLRVPSPADGAYKVLLRALADGDASVIAGLRSEKREAATFKVERDGTWSLSFSLAADQLSFGRAERVAESLGLGRVPIPERAIASAQAAAGLAATTSPSPAPATTSTATPTPASTPTPTATPARSPTPSPTASPTPQTTPALSTP
jgi:hypothetical protein